MNRSNKVPVRAWAQRAGWQAAEQIQDKARWDSLLSWPLSTLRQERKDWPIKVDLQPYLHLASSPAPHEASSAVVPSNDTDYSQTFSQDADQLSWHADQIRRIEIAAATTSMSYEPSLAYAQPVMSMQGYSLSISAIDPTLHMMGTTGVTFMPTVAFDDLQHRSGAGYVWTDHSSHGHSSRSASVEEEDFSVLLSSNTH